MGRQWAVTVGIEFRDRYVYSCIFAGYLSVKSLAFWVGFWHLMQ
jgi:hypothetical protein